VKRLLDYYRQFQDLNPGEFSRELRERRQQERAQELVVVGELDLSRTVWHQPPDPESVNAATFALRRALNAYPDPAASAVRELAASRHGLPVEQVAVGHGAAELMRDTCAALLGRGGELLVPWPSWRPLPELATRAGGGPVAVAGADLSALAARVGPETRAVALCSPNDPTGAALSRSSLRAFAAALPENVMVLVDEALADFREPGEDAAPLVAELPNLLVFRTFSKAHALAGLRIGYVAGPAELVARLSPDFSVNAPAQAAAAWALEYGDAAVARRRSLVARERSRLASALEGTPLSFGPSEASFVWLGSAEHDGATLASHLAARRVLVAPGEQWGDSQRVRVTLRGGAATDRLVTALGEL
jgi:histidinol-phosphate aminotransferase